MAIIEPYICNELSPLVLVKLNNPKILPFYNAHLHKNGVKIDLYVENLIIRSFSIVWSILLAIIEMLHISFRNAGKIELIM